MYKTSKVKFQQKNTDIKKLSAEKVVDILFDLFKPKSVIDVGCGTGLLLKYFQSKGSKIMGYEGKWINKDLIDENISNKVVKIIDFEQLELLKTEESERPILWNQDIITWPHKQNMVVYLHKTDLKRPNN